MARQRNDSGTMLLVTRRDGRKMWRSRWHEYRNGRRVHRSAVVGSIEEYPTEKLAKEAAKDLRPIRYFGKRTKEAKARCSDELYAAMVEEQKHRCAICKAEVTRLCVDHDHETGATRALLCGKCNAGIGLLGDDPEVLRRAAAYIEFHKQSDWVLHSTKPAQRNP